MRNGNMKNSKFGYIVISIFFLCLFIAPYKANACSVSAVQSYYQSNGLGGSGMEDQAIASCLRQNEQARAQSCTANSTYNGSGQCVCNSGYFLNGNTCITASVMCSNYYGTNSTPTGQINAQGGPTCGCVSGYQWNSSNTQCVAATPTCTANSTYNGSICTCNSGYFSSGGACVTGSQSCQSTYGPYSTWAGEKTAQGGLLCGCSTGYQVDTSNTTCVQNSPTPVPVAVPSSPASVTATTCTANSTYNGVQCICNVGYSSNNGACITGAQLCVSSYGANAVGTGTGCACASNYQWNSTMTSCVPNIPTPVATPAKSLSSHSSGLSANQIAAILSLLQAFGADQSVIDNVRVSLGQ